MPSDEFVGVALFTMGLLDIIFCAIIKLASGTLPSIYWVGLFIVVSSAEVWYKTRIKS